MRPRNFYDPWGELLNMCLYLSKIIRQQTTSLLELHGVGFEHKSIHCCRRWVHKFACSNSHNLLLFPTTPTRERYPTILLSSLKYAHMSYETQIDSIWIKLSGEIMNRPGTTRDACRRVCEAFHQAEERPRSEGLSSEIKTYLAERKIWAYYCKSLCVDSSLWHLADSRSRRSQSLAWRSPGAASAVEAKINRAVSVGTSSTYPSCSIIKTGSCD